MGSAVNTISNGVSQASNFVAAPGSFLAGTAANVLKGGGDDAPKQSPADPNLAALQSGQVQQAQQFRSNIPQYQQQLGENLRSGINNQLSGANQNTTQSDAARGLLYGGVHQGDIARNYGQAQNAVATGTQSINDRLQQTANNMDASAIGTGTSIQQNAQAAQDNIYNQTMAQINAQNSMFGSALGTAGGLAIAGAL